MTSPSLFDAPKAPYTPPRLESIGSFDSSTVAGSVIGIPIGPRGGGLDWSTDSGSNDDLF